MFLVRVTLVSANGSVLLSADVSKATAQAVAQCVQRHSVYTPRSGGNDERFRPLIQRREQRRALPQRSDPITPSRSAGTSSLSGARADDRPRCS
jgi:hypothetical protein